MDVAIRLLLIPSQDVKMITGIKLTNAESNYSRKHYILLAKTFATSFYVRSRQQLEFRLKELLTPGVVKENKSDVLSTGKNLGPEYYINYLLQKETVKGKVKLVNFRKENKYKILDFYEFIMILLKIKYYDYMIEKLSSIPVEGSVVGGGTTERKLISYINTNTNRLTKNKSVNKSEKKPTLKKHKKTKKKLQHKEKLINSKKTKNAMKIQLL